MVGKLRCSRSASTLSSAGVAGSIPIDVLPILRSELPWYPPPASWHSDPLCTLPPRPHSVVRAESRLIVPNRNPRTFTTKPIHIATECSIRTHYRSRDKSLLGQQ